MWMKIKGVEINFDSVETFETDESNVGNNKVFKIVFFFVSGGYKTLYFDNQKNRDEVIFKIRSKLTKHEIIEISE